MFRGTWALADMMLFGGLKASTVLQMALILGLDPRSKILTRFRNPKRFEIRRYSFTPPSIRRYSVKSFDCWKIWMAKVSHLVYWILNNVKRKKRDTIYNKQESF